MGKALTAASWVITIIFSLVIPIACIIIAGVYHDSCPVQPYINIYLYVAGAFGLLNFCFIVLTFMFSKNKCGGNEECLAANSCVFIVIEILLSLFLFAWFICGSVWVYRMYPNYKDMQCDTTLYLFTFSIITIQWILLGLKTITSCCQRRQDD